MANDLPTLAEEIARQVDKAALRAADDARQAVTTRVHDAETAKRRAEAAVESARAALDQALGGEESSDPRRKLAELEDAERLDRFAGLALQAASAAMAATADDHRRARGVAHQPLFAAGIQRRLDATRLGDVAKAMLKAAQQEFDLGTSMLEAAKSGGTPTLIQSFGSFLGSYDDEVRRWTGDNAIRAEWWQGWKPLVGEEIAA